MIAQPLPHSGKIFFKTSTGTVITSCFARWGPLVSTDTRYQTPEGEIKNTVLFIAEGFSQHRLATRLVDQGQYIHTNANESFRITGLEDFGSQTTFVGLRQNISITFVRSTAAGLISEWAFESSGALLTDSSGLNNLTNVNTVTWNSDKPSEIPFNVGSALFSAVSLQRLEISNVSQIQLNITGSYAILFRFKLTTLPSGAVFGLIGKANALPNRSYYLYIANSSLKLECELSVDGTAAVQCLGATLISAGVWYSFASIYDGVDIRNYLNGSLDRNGSGNPKAHTTGIFDALQKFQLGCRADNTQFFDGKLAHMFICNQSKSAAQIAAWHTTDILE